MEQKFAIIKLETLENIQNQLNDIIKKLDTNANHNHKLLDDWITEDEAMILLKAKSTTLYNLRKSKKIVATMTRPIFYSLNSINNYLKNMCP